MSGKPNQIAFGSGGVVITSKSEGSSSKKMLNKAITSSEGSSSKRVLNKATELNSSSRMIFKDKHTSCSSHFAKQHKTEKFVDNSSGKLGYKMRSSTHLVWSSMTRYWGIPESSRPKSSSRKLFIPTRVPQSSTIKKLTITRFPFLFQIKINK